MRRRFSRHMPRYAPESQPLTFANRVAISVFVCFLVGTGITLLALFVEHPWSIPALGILILVLALMARRDMLHRLKLIEERSGEDIGTFARAFDRRNEPFDPWVVRAVWDAIQPRIDVHGRPIPLRPDDTLYETLRLDPEELYVVVYPEVCARAGRREDPFGDSAGVVATVGEFVRFVTAQPLIGAHPAEVHAPI